MNLKKKNRRIEKKSSRTAAFTCVSRASSYYEKSPYYKSNDYIAPRLLTKILQPLVKSKRIRSFLMKKLGPEGIYEYVIARTKFIDKIFIKALSNNFNQILIFGAGFDTRGIRLTEGFENIKVFELDVMTTISDKLKQYKKRKVDPGRVRYVKINFNSENIKETMKGADFEYNKKTLYILEGIIMYLNESAINEDFNFISKSAGKGSEVVFDYIYQSVLEEKNLFKGEQEIYRTVKKSGESWTFGIEKGEIIQFLQKRGLELIKQLDSQKLEEMYFQDKNGNTVGYINSTHCIVHAKVK
ncbi:MAG: SAM-dependent methyltransferase [Candidatus Lokiarchaeota archaeon]